MEKRSNIWVLGLEIVISRREDPSTSNNLIYCLNLLSFSLGIGKRRIVEFVIIFWYTGAGNREY